MNRREKEVRDICRHMDMMPPLVATAIRAPFIGLFMTFHMVMSCLCAVGLLHYEYYHGWRVPWARKPS